jgi:hypothetical protein
MQLSIVKQSSMFEEKICKNGVTKTCHYVVKNAPFTIQYESLQADFTAAQFKCQLIYDNVNEFRPIPFLWRQPLEYSVHVGPQNCMFTIEFRIKVLSSQYEHSLFLIHVDVTCANGQKMNSLSEPICCVSKAEQILRKKEAKTAIQTSQQTSESESTTISKSLLPRKRKRIDEECSVSTDLTQKMLNTLTSIRQTQLEQNELLKHLFTETTKQTQQTSVLSPSPSPSPSPPPPITETTTKSKQTELSFEDAFTAFFTIFNSLNENIRASKIRHLLSTSSPDIVNAVSSFICDVSSNDNNIWSTVYWSKFLTTTPTTVTSSTHNHNHTSTSLQSFELHPNNDNNNKDNGNNDNNNKGCICSECPFKREIDRLDECYYQLLSPTSSSSIFSNDLTLNENVD